MEEGAALRVAATLEEAVVAARGRAAGMARVVLVKVAREAVQMDLVQAELAMEGMVAGSTRHTRHSLQSCT